MREPFYWSIPLGRIFGITVRLHWLFPFVALALILRAGYDPAAPKDTSPPAGAW